MTWERISDDAILWKGWKVCRVWVQDVEWFEAWMPNRCPFVKRFRDPKRAKDFVESETGSEA